MKVELGKVTVWLILINLVVVGFGAHAGMVSGTYNPSIYLSLIACIGLILVGIVPDDVLRIGDSVEWTDSEEHVRRGKLLGQYAGNWLVDWQEHGASIGVIDPKELRKVGK